MRLPLVKSWSKLHGLTLGQESIVTDMRMLYGRAHGRLACADLPKPGEAPSVARIPEVKRGRR